MDTSTSNPATFDSTLSAAKLRQLEEAAAQNLFSNHFNYNALTPDPVYGVETDANGKLEPTLINYGQSIEQLLTAFA